MLAFVAGSRVVEYYFRNDVKKWKLLKFGQMRERDRGTAKI